MNGGNFLLTLTPSIFWAGDATGDAVNFSPERSVNLFNFQLSCYKDDQEKICPAHTPAQLSTDLNLFIRKKATNQLSRLVEKSVHETESSSSSEEDDKDHHVENELFQALYETPPPCRNEKDSDLFQVFPGGETFNKDTFPNKAMRELFIKYNTPSPVCRGAHVLFGQGRLEAQAQQNERQAF
ncbi:hypothetical protein Hamer_G028400 [Homarus americanus]|uniref:Uncharacterized protein n=1 Tax=Homarus americanus TaxID=6706 RepID=A0A8J5N7Q9_HOMAM|nr:hypothetical protein Hamer_G028400 [Homarus americanus]